MVDFILPISQKDTHACQLLINDLKSQRSDDAAAWEQPLFSLAKGIKLHYQHETLIGILKCLPNAISEALFSRLLNASNFNYSCLKTWVEYINSLTGDAKTHQTALINILLNSPIIFLNQPEIEKLLLLLDGKEQSLLLTHLRRQAEQNTLQPSKKTLGSNQKQLIRIHTSNYKQLLTFLALHVSQNELTLQAMLNDNPVLANLLIGQLLEIESDTTKQKELLHRILKEYQFYDWNDHHFIKKIESKLIIILTTVSAPDVKEWFQLYLKIIQQQPNTISKAIQFLDKVFDATKNVNIVANGLDVATLGEHQMAIDFLIHSKIKERSLRQSCFKKINIEQLGLYHQHMLITGPMGYYPDEELITDFIHLFCSHINKLLAPQKLLKQLAIMVSASPENTAQLAITVAIKHLSSPQLISQWLQALIEVNRNNALLIPQCVLFIKEHPHEIELIVAFLKGLSDKDLLTLYLSIFTQELDKGYFSCFIELFKYPEKHTQLFYLLRNTPIIHPELLNEFLSQLDDKALINLLEKLLTHACPFSEYKTTINQVLLIFCQRLYCEPTPSAAINQWQQHPCAKVLADALLETPECMSHLTTSYSTVYSLVTWTNPEDAIKHRMDAVLNCYEFSEDRLKRIALIWSTHFHAHPDQFNSVFSTLRATENNRTPTGRKNLSGIMKSCWELISPEISYKEEDFFTLVQTSRSEYFNLALIQASQLEYMRQEPYLSSLRLAKTRGIPQNIDLETLIVLLVHSPNTPINWKKATFWLKKLTYEEQLNFIKKLLEHIRYSNNNPILSEQIYRFIVHHPLFSTFLPQLDPAHWYWLMQNIPDTQLMEQAPTWLDALIAKHGVHKLNLGKILSLLPPRTSLLATILQKKTLAFPDIFAQIASQLSTESNATIPLISVHRYVKEQDQSWRRRFIQTILSQLKTTKINSSLLHILQDLLLDENTSLFGQNSVDRDLIVDYLNLLDALIKQAENKRDFAELDQLMRSIITMLIDKEPHWGQLLSKEEAFSHTVVRWISTLDLKNLSINNHTLMHLLINCQPAQLDPQLTNNPLWKKILQSILFNPPSELSAEQFIALLNWHLPESKILLSQQLLTKTQLSEVHLQSLSVLTDILEPIELFQLLDSHENPQLIAKGLLTHKKGLESLSSIQQAQLFAYIRSSADLIAILNSDIPVDTLSKFTRKLFQIYGQNANTLSRTLEQWLITPEALATLANFTIDKKEQQILNEVLQEKPYYHDYLHEYLQHPTLDMEINEHSYLNKAAYNNVMNEETLKLYPAQAIEQLTPEDIFKTVKYQFYLNQKIAALSVFFTPFNNKTQNPLTLLQSAQWQQQLSLIHDGLLEIIRIYKEKKTPEATKRAIEQTDLYKECLLSFLTLPINAEIEKTLSTQLIPLLQSYLSQMALVDQEHHRSLQNTLSNYSSQLQTIKFFSLPQLFDFFNTNYPAITFQQEELNLLSNAYDLHTDWLKRFGLEPEPNCTELLTVGLNAASLVDNNQINQWLIQCALFSSLSTFIDETSVQHFITSIKPDKLSILINSFSEQEQACHKAQQLLQKLNLAVPITELIKQLLNIDSTTLNQLITVAESLNLLTLKNLLCLARRTKELELNDEQVATLCLSSLRNESLQDAWLQVELEQMAQRIAHVSKRLEQITKLGLGYASDAHNNERLEYLAEKCLANDILIHCLNSYKALFLNPDCEPHPYLQNLDKILDKPHKTQEILLNLNIQLIQYIIHAAINSPVVYFDLLEKIIHSPHKERASQIVQAELNKQIKQENAPQPTSLIELSAEQIESYSSDKLNTILSLQRLLFLSNPIPELRSFAAQSEQQGRERQLFSADASLYVTLLSIEKKQMSLLKKAQPG